MRFLPQSYRRSAALLSMMAPGIILLLVFQYLPMYGILIAFKDFNMSLGILRSPWIGLDNFVELFGRRDFLQALRNTVVISCLQLTFGFFSPILLAILLNEVRIDFYKRGVQTLTYAPHFFSWVILGGIVIFILGSEGPINYLLLLSGLTPIQFLTNDYWFIAVLIISGIWQSAGFGSIIYLAALTNISPELYESAAIDGASRFRRIWHITIPSLRPTIVILFILSLGNFLSAGFDQVYNLYNPLVYDVADILDTYVLRRLTMMEYSTAATAGFFKSFIGLMLIVMANWLANHLSDGEQGLW
jgi:putative aldouronate transport system permease protein